MPLSFLQYLLMNSQRWRGKKNRLREQNKCWDHYLFPERVFVKSQSIHVSLPRSQTFSPPRRHPAHSAVSEFKKTLSCDQRRRTTHVYSAAKYFHLQLLKVSLSRTRSGCNHQVSLFLATAYNKWITGAMTSFLPHLPHTFRPHTHPSVVAYI